MPEQKQYARHTQRYEAGSGRAARRISVAPAMSRAFRSVNVSVDPIHLIRRWESCPDTPFSLTGQLRLLRARKHHETAPRAFPKSLLPSRPHVRSNCQAEEPSDSARRPWVQLEPRAGGARHITRAPAVTQDARGTRLPPDFGVNTALHQDGLPRPCGC